MFQFLCGISTLEKYFNKCKLCFYNILESKILFTIQHNLNDPFIKSFEFVPVSIRFTFNFATYCLTRQVTSSQNDLFFENYAINDNKFCYYISKNYINKITNDFRKIDMISIDINKKSFTKLNNCYIDFDITANHLCSLMYQSLGSSVTCYNDELDKITFKDTNIIR